ncbi:uncharacterized protein L969DRAFT_62492 [Mixia osmundae IAM 14324]|uniref:Protein kinase domain-containing protein n=1 Tax=Mixia osmundae (strain CBS 9802 / IAM 14324 / JCM 22182 / KY 12970) TaxID=764103 RepID=G7DVR3_MIXOS|nr:uncharacterized protein L969DRAFT_62492 [Mixia osmundae IAM 14324]KEI39646.1 hypothetical protein L969DRAFT_62492 [Mixia osmundae IAM 14324]GAA94673.1 hypothetical protein E5Q_01326 [Mixia osmundae IAM 14324]
MSDQIPMYTSSRDRQHSATQSAMYGYPQQQPQSARSSIFGAVNFATGRSGYSQQGQGAYGRAEEGIGLDPHPPPLQYAQPHNALRERRLRGMSYSPTEYSQPPPPRQRYTGPTYESAAVYSNSATSDASARPFDPYAASQEHQYAPQAPYYDPAQASPRSLAPDQGAYRSANHSVTPESVSPTNAHANLQERQHADRPPPLSRGHTSPMPEPQQPYDPYRSYSNPSRSRPATGRHESEEEMAVDAPEQTFRRIRSLSDLRPVLESVPSGRRADPQGGVVSPLKALTQQLAQTYHLVNPAFRYELSYNPRRVLTKPSKPCGNDGHDNEDSDYILYVNDWLGTDEGNKYLILDVLGQGTFGQVVKCQNMKTHEIVAVKVVKNKPAYFNQSMMEVTILEMLNNAWDPQDRHHILRLKDTFIHARHLCLVFELLSSNLYELIKQNNFRGLSTSLVRVFTSQLLDALTVLNEARLIHCDLKPENILLETLQSPQIKVIDFGSACHERQTVYTYIQSRFYRSPEVLLGLPYSSPIDMWSLGCICVELFLGLPLFPGTSEYNQVTRIVEMLGLPPNHMLDVGKQSANFFDLSYDPYGNKAYRLKSLEQYSKEHNTQEQPSKKYFQATKLPDIIKTYPMTRKNAKQSDIDREMNNRISFIDFVQGLLNMNPIERWSPQQAKLHPFVKGEPLTEPFVPPMSLKTPSRRTSAVPQSAPSATMPLPTEIDRPYGGLPPGPRKPDTMAYVDAAAYGKHLAQQQAYTAASEAKAKRQSQISMNPYSVAEDTQGLQAASRPFGDYSMRPQQADMNVPVNPPPVHHYPARGRALTITDAVPPQIQKLGLGMGGFAGHSVTPVLNRDDQQEAWERRNVAAGQLGRRASLNRHHPGIDHLTEQAEMAWGLPSYRIPSSVDRANYMNAQASQPFSVMVDQQRALQAQAQAQQQRASGAIAAPPMVYHASTGSANRYEAFANQGGGYDSGFNPGEGMTSFIPLNAQSGHRASLSYSGNVPYQQQAMPPPPPPVSERELKQRQRNSQAEAPPWS